ncbi:serine/threonine protein kinase [Nostoc spongiaeforme FACHB-130]|uniref:non-specific serine/threonine protein kinase n=1 Tax=Nostoc spongiaeforme FACHB-130 TaxID=1357510 RepID=A0ABR8FYE1_9NOSO|nr:serine/threonine-protein kinase [Nostoc spongiaeforme]MBD2596346.1 serine/threonine protein kinase [Nostoc spongiaeforme FACHB-130]
MEAYCTRPRCPRPKNYFADLDDVSTLKTAQQKYCATCGMPLILDGRYMSTKLLGRGGFASAFLARDRRIPGIRACVVKQFQPAGDISANQLRIAQQLFEREADVLAEIGREHEQIPELYAFFQITVPSFTQPNQEEQFFYLVQEYIDGLNLEEELTQKGKFSEAEILYMLQEILKILNFVHDKNIIHRDIKPSNIMRRQDGKLFLLDFGAVKQVTNVASGTVASSTGIYSAGFAPPEQMTGNQVFPCTDLYALAVTAVTLLTGQPAPQLFDPLINQWTWRSHVDIDPHLASVLDKMLLPAVSQRFQSAEEVLKELFPQFIPPTTLTNTPTQPPVIQPPATFSTTELLSGAAVSGFEGALIAIALSSLISPMIAFTIAILILSGMIFAQTRRWIKTKNLLIVAVISFAIVLFVPALQAGMNIQQIVILGITGSLIAIAVTTLFQLIYKLLSMMF